MNIREILKKENIGRRCRGFGRIWKVDEYTELVADFFTDDAPNIVFGYLLNEIVNEEFEWVD